MRSTVSVPRVAVLVSHLGLDKLPSRMAQLVASAAIPFQGRAEIRILDCTLDNALDLVRSLHRDQPLDAIVSTGATGQYLREQQDLPVVLMRHHALDLLRAVAEARAVASRIAILTFREIDQDLTQLLGQWKIDARLATYGNLRQARRQVADAKRAGCGAVVGSSTVAQLAEAAGLRGFLAIGAQATREALEDAISLVRSAQAEADRRRWLDAVLRSLHDGMLAVDASARVQSINPAMATLLEVDADAVLGRAVDGLGLPAELLALLQERREVRHRVIWLHRRHVVANLVPLADVGEGPGVVVTVQQTAAVRQAERRIRSSERRGTGRARYRLQDIVGVSVAIASTRAMAQAYARSDATLLIRGESGTGKELFAQGVHLASARHAGPFVALNCGAFPENLLESELFGHEEGAFTGARRGGKPGLFEAAHQGSVFLDEIGDMPLALQTRLLRVLQEREVLRLGSTEPVQVNVRVMAATHRDLVERVRLGQFRQDLYYRLAILPLHVPPLRQRKEDIEPIARHYLEQRLQGRPDEVSKLWRQLKSTLLQHDWPGNVRELENVLERAVVLASAGCLSTADVLLPDADGITEMPSKGLMDCATSLHKVGRISEQEHARQVVQACGGHLAEAARVLGVSRSTLWRRLRRDGSE